ncbi:MAG TPA: SGNH/GDSL hydrolase family protein [Stellaceae bacterium]|nr:SGNH/GDSL hydrolase family protein [Stellaceae bacterium]
MAQENRFERLPRWQRASVVGAFALIAVVAVALLAEGAVRLRQWIRFGTPWAVEQTYVFDAASSLRIPIPNGRFGPVRINSFGFRNPEIPVEKPSGRLRIAFLGGSTTYCAEVSSNEMTWPHLVIAAIMKTFPELDIDYINAGVPGYTTATLKLYLEKRVAHFHPDVIVIYEATNDLAANSFTLAREQGVTSRGIDESMGWLTRRSLLLDLLAKNLAVRERQNAKEGEGTIALDQTRLAAMYRGDLTKLVEASKAVAKLVAVATFASRLRVGQSPPELRKSAITSLYHMPYLEPETILEGFLRYNIVIRSVATEKDALLVEGEDLIPADAVHFTDSVHFTDAGSVQMANRVSGALLKSRRFLDLVAASRRGGHVDAQ